MRIGVSGHQDRDGISWPWVRAEMRSCLSGRPLLQAYTSLAEGSDQIFAEEAVSVGGKLHAVVPISDYDSYFNGEALLKYRELLAQSKVIDLNLHLRPELAFLEAGKWIVRKCSLLIAVWDGEPADGLGGTADVVAYARELGRPIVCLNPIERSTSRLG